VEVELHERRRVPADAQVVHGRAPHRHLDRDPAPMEPVRALALDLHRRRLRDGQLDFSRQRFDLVRRRDRRLLDDVPFTVTRGRPQAEPDLGPVALVEADEVPREPRPAAEEHEQEPRRERVERPGVTRLRPVALAQPLHDRERRRPGGLVHQHEPARCLLSHGAPV
jgi:hypothetical protein